MRLTVIVILLALPLRSSAFLPPPYGGKAVTAPLPDLPTTLDPVEAERESELQIAKLQFDTLYALGPTGRPVPHLLDGQQPVLSANGLTWQAGLRTGIQLHNGQTLTTAQVVESLNRLRRSRAGYLLAPVTSVSAQGNQITIRLRRRTPELSWLLSAPSCGIAVHHRGRWIGTGPFKLKSWTSMGLDLTAHPGHFAGRPYLDEVRLRVLKRRDDEVARFQARKLQISLHGTTVYGRQPAHRYATVNARATTLVYLGIGADGARPYMRDARFRRALLLGIDRRRLGRLAATGRHEVAHQPVCRWLMPRRRKPKVPNRKQARQRANRLLGQLVGQYSQLKRDAASGKLKLDLLIDASRSEAGIVANLLVAELDRIGIAVTIDARPAREYRRRLDKGSYRLALGWHPVQVAHRRDGVTLAGVLVTAGQPAVARRCMAKKRCNAALAARVMKQLPLIPLVHSSASVAHDARLGQLRVVSGGWIHYPDLFWMRGGKP